MATKVSRLVNYATKYELVLTNGSATYLVAYTARKGKTDLIKAIRARGESMLAICQLDDEARFTFTTPQSAQLGTDWTVRFTGRTQKDAICTQSEHRYVGTVAVEIQHRFSPDSVSPLYCEHCGASETDHRL